MLSVWDAMILLGTTIKSEQDVFSDLLADGKQTRINSEKFYVATTVAEDCVLGVSIALRADTPSLTEGYCLTHSVFLLAIPT